MHITMNNVELKEAVELWLENEGLTPDSYTIEVKFVAGRNGNEGRIEIDAQKKGNTVISEESEDLECESSEPEEITTGPTKDNPFNANIVDSTNKKTVGDLFNS